MAQKFFKGGLEFVAHNDNCAHASVSRSVALQYLYSFYGLRWPALNCFIILLSFSESE